MIILYDWAYCKTWTGVEWSGFVKHGLDYFVKGGFVKHRFVKGGFVKHGFVKGGFVKGGFPSLNILSIKLSQRLLQQTQKEIVRDLNAKFLYS